MRILRLLFFACVAGAAVHYVRKHRPAPDAAVQAPEAVAAVSKQGFISLPPLCDARKDQVLIVAPLNCPREAGQRAAGLEQLLNSEGIPAVRTASVEFPVSGQGDQSQLKDSVDKVMMGAMPIVFINGRAKNNPDIGDVEAEYRSSKGH